MLQFQLKSAKCLRAASYPPPRPRNSSKSWGHTAGARGGGGDEAGGQAVDQEREEVACCGFLPTSGLRK